MPHSETTQRESEVLQEQNVSTLHLWNFLHTVGMAHMANLPLTLKQIAPEPGTLVYVEARPLSVQWKQWNPVLFSAIDLYSMLQIARLYLTSSVASSVDFLKFIVEKFPFTIREIRTPADRFFTHPSTPQPDHHFTAAAQAQGIVHTMSFQPSSDRLLSVMGKHFYALSNEPHPEPTSESQRMGELVNYLFFHNNHRSIPLLGGKTPLQKLIAFGGYDDLLWFDPYDAITPRTSGRGGRRA